MEYGYDVTFSKDEILSIMYSLSKNKINESEYLKGVYDFATRLLSYYEQ